MTFNKVAIGMIGLFLILTLFGTGPWYYLLLSIAQLVFVPLTLHLLGKAEQRFFRILPYAALLGLTAVFLLEMTQRTPWDIVLALFYLAFTILVTCFGAKRLLQRGFARFEEFMIDIGCMYLAIGGAWYFASVVQLDTGFSPILTWLTGIHFHYASFLLPVFAGFLGRLNQNRFYKMAGIAILLAPILVAVGISYAVVLELLGVMLYMIGIYSLITLAWKTSFSRSIQAWLIRLSFSALGISILFSLCYAFGNMTGVFYVSIDFMLRFHGVMNGVVFAMVGLIGWMINCPRPKAMHRSFPVSRIRGKRVIGEKVLATIQVEHTYNGLVDSMHIYEPQIERESLSKSVIDFYENTNDYRLFSQVKWHGWFKPFAWIYQHISKRIGQLNLPFSSKEVEMTGRIIGISETVDGRTKPRVWLRKVNEETIFVAIYSFHEGEDRTYMDIALPLPGSTMIGTLALQNKHGNLQLTSKQQENAQQAGIYLAVGRQVLTLPLEETFVVGEEQEGSLRATHKMRIFSIPFLTINYRIVHKNKG
ncbi:YndJ family protein [Oceanobacillus jordanicus]|uniref:YndJ family protein n=1 Tax=Oceanobacillus jordanicus TaxID=2867266 RepID=A0AAW5B787_9BACI|nr:YndJ family protein [Oceanobacillus jordanicus]MCG3420384.1 YndJ family protein [Oceanobacillus jordanicus]